jgi:hypothetical protein
MCCASSCKSEQGCKKSLLARMAMALQVPKLRNGHGWEPKVQERRCADRQSAMLKLDEKMTSHATSMNCSPGRSEPVFAVICILSYPVAATGRSAK